MEDVIKLMRLREHYKSLVKQEERPRHRDIALRIANFPRMFGEASWACTMASWEDKIRQLDFQIDALTDGSPPEISEIPRGVKGWMVR